MSSRTVRNFGRIGDAVDIPDLVEIQRKSYSRFLQDGFSLKKSTLTPRGPIYEDLLVCRQSR